MPTKPIDLSAYTAAPSISEDEMEVRIAALKTMTPKQLREEWARVWGTACYTHNYSLLRRRIAWRLRCLCYGGLALSALAKASDLADVSQMRERTPCPTGRAGSRKPATVEGTAAVPPPAPAKGPGRVQDCPPGSYFIKTHAGSNHYVYVVTGGRYSYKGALFPSLTAVARRIAGYRVSGNRFFSSSTTLPSA